jgi:hypothetical protein
MTWEKLPFDQQVYIAICALALQMEDEPETRKIAAGTLADAISNPRAANSILMHITAIGPRRMSMASLAALVTQHRHTNEIPKLPDAMDAVASKELNALLAAHLWGYQWLAPATDGYPIRHATLYPPDSAQMLLAESPNQVIQLTWAEADQRGPNWSGWLSAYSTSNSGAWELIKEMQKRGFTYAMQEACSLTAQGNPLYLARFTNRNNDCVFFSAVAEDAPLATARAVIRYLKAITIA